MKQLDYNQMELSRGGEGYMSDKEVLCNLGLGGLAAYSLSFLGVPLVGLAALSTAVIAGGIITMACDGWFDNL